MKEKRKSTKNNMIQIKIKHKQLNYAFHVFGYKFSLQFDK